MNDIWFPYYGAVSDYEMEKRKYEETKKIYLKEKDLRQAFEESLPPTEDEIRKRFGDDYL